MTGGAAAYLVTRREDGFGEVHPLNYGKRYTLGRGPMCRIILKDELCSREHAEIHHAAGRWRLRDLKSLNGTRVNDATLNDSECELSSGDLVQVGRTQLLFLDDLADLPSPPPPTRTADGLSIKRRLAQTRYQTPLPPDMVTESTTNGATPALLERRSVKQELSLLYRMTLEMTNAGTVDELVECVLDSLIGSVLAETAAVYQIKGGPEFQLVKHRHREQDAEEKKPLLLPQSIVESVLHDRQAVLAGDDAGEALAAHPPGEKAKQVLSLICAPVLRGERVTGLLHLYSTTSKLLLSSEDLDFVVAVAKQYGQTRYQLERQESLSKENQNLRDNLRIESELVGASSVIKELENKISRVAQTTATVLIRGESGSGKELVARAIHYSSSRRDSPFVCLNCAALSETLLESELFGHEKGAFTGATDRKIGKFEAADHGTIFLDEIGEMNPATQAKLLRVLEGHPFERVGGNTAIRVNVRVVAATNQPLEQFLKENKFRKDLFYRLQVVEIRVAPLRERKSDVAELADHFLRRFTRETGRKIRGFTPAALKKMEDYHWPGNVRELRNVIERAVALSGGNFLDTKDIWLSSLDLDGPAPLPVESELTYKPMTIEEVEKEHILRTLQFTEWNKSQAASILNIERSTLDRKIKAYDLKR